VNFIGTAGWNLPRPVAKHFPASGTHLQRYAQVFNCVEINSSFYRSHSLSTYRRWADSTPSTFRFAVKMPRTITHDAQLRRTRAAVQQFLSEIKGLGRKLGPLLIQLPPSMEFDARVASRFFLMLGDLHGGPVVCEPRHKSWFAQRATRLLVEHRITRVIADPAPTELGETLGAAPQRLVYYRLHGSPRMYWSNYPQDRLFKWAKEVRGRGGKTASWIIFDNTAAGCATSNALQLDDLLK
jgi:uncharacterized protein YecE (DUF72 family)